MAGSSVWKRVKATPRCDWPVADRELSGAGNFVGIYGGEHIAATEFVIGATLVQYGCTATDIMIGLIIGNILAVLSFTFLCATLATDTRLTLYTYLRRIWAERCRRFIIWSLVWGFLHWQLPESVFRLRQSAEYLAYRFSLIGIRPAQNSF